MNAKEMFNLVNYKLIEETDEKLIYAHRHCRDFIEFYKNVIAIWCYSIHGLPCGDDIKQPISVTLSELEAINQQVKELGWYD